MLKAEYSKKPEDDEIIDDGQFEDSDSDESMAGDIRGLLDSSTVEALEDDSEHENGTATAQQPTTMARTEPIVEPTTNKAAE